MLEQRNSLKLKQLEKYFVPAGIDAKVILQAFKIQQNRRMLASSRARQFAVQQKIEEQVSKLDLLQVTGRQSVLPEPVRRVSQRKGIKDIKDIKVVLDNPINRIVDAISQDPDCRLYQRELSELQRFSASSPKQFKDTLSPPKGVHSQKDLQAPLFQRLQKHPSIDSPKKQGMEYYEQLILNNPVLYRKIMMAYNASKRQLQREQHLDRRPSHRRETNYDTKFTFKSNLVDLTRNVTDPKKTPSLLQLRQFQLTVCLTNRILIYPQQQILYRAFICKGNNGMLVKSIIKSRPWWSLRSHSEIDSCNLVWTEWKKGKAIQKMQTKQIRRGVASEKDVDLSCHSKKRQLVLLAEKKIRYFGKIVAKEDELWQKYEKIPQFQNYLKFSSKINEPKFDEIAKLVLSSKNYTHLQVQKEHKAHNHIPGCLHLHSKKLLFLNLKNYYEKQGKDIFAVVPLTFHITKGVDDPEFTKFTQHFQSLLNQTQIKGKGKMISNIWICKPGENSNRGNGISVLSSLADIRALIGQKCTGKRTVIIQKYFENPFLYNKRKFDLRCYVLITTVNGVVKGYWYQEGYIRTASKEFTLKNLQNKFIHLTNDAIQKKGEEYGKFENYNKISYADFEKYLESNAQGQQKFNFGETIQKMKTVATDLIFATAKKLNPKRKQYCFQLFGLDFMLDDKLQPFLIQANSNPCIQVDGAVLGKVIPSMLQNVIRVAIDPIFPPPYSESIKNRYQCSNLFETNKMVLVYDSYLQENEDQHEVPLVNENENEEENDEHQAEVQQ